MKSVLAATLRKALASSLVGVGVVLANVPSSAQNGDGLVTVGAGGTFTLGVGETWDQVFQRAIDQGLQGGGGALRVLPGTYALAGVVKLDKPNLTVLGSRGATLLSSGGPVGIFDVTASGCSVRGLRLEATLAAGPVTLVRVLADDFTLEDCELAHPSPMNATPGDVTFLFLGGGASRAAARVEGNTFRFGECYAVDAQGVARRVACGAQIVGVHARDGSGLTIFGNAFHSFESVFTDSQGTKFAASELDHAVLLEGETEAAIIANTFTLLGSAVATVPAILRLAPSASRPTSRVGIHDNFFENPPAEFSVLLEGAELTSITGNVFGRSIGGVSLQPSPSGDRGRANTIWGNDFHNIGNFRVDKTAVHIAAQDVVEINQNQFTLCGRDQVVLEADVGAVHVVGNTFVIDNTNVTACTAITIRLLPTSPGGLVVHGNSALGNPFNEARWCTVWHLDRGCFEKIDLEKNWSNRLLGCGPSPSCMPGILPCE